MAEPVQATFLTFDQFLKGRRCLIRNFSDAALPRELQKSKAPKKQYTGFDVALART